MKIAIIGAGIMGVASAYCIKETYPQFEIVVLAKELTPNTTSDGAAGLWEPFIPGDTSESLVTRWSRETYRYVMDLIRNDPYSGRAGLTTTHGFNLSIEETTEVPYWADIPYDFEMLSKKDLQRFPDYVKSGFKYTSVFIESRRFIPWLSKKFLDMGGKFFHREVHYLGELSDEFDIVVNCTGLGANELVHDDKMVPIRGQVMRVKAPWVKEHIALDNIKENTTTYILPNQDYVVLGGTCEINNTNVEVDEREKSRILTACQDILPSLVYAEHICDWVGLRPGRSSTRLEKEDVISHNKTLKVVHNYGHGGSGITMHRGCALDVLKLVKECLTELKAFKSML